MHLTLPSNDPEARDNNDNTALQSACRRKLTAFDAKRIIQVVSFLLDNGDNVHPILQ